MTKIVARTAKDFENSAAFWKERFEIERDENAKYAELMKDKEPLTPMQQIYKHMWEKPVSQNNEGPFKPEDFSFCGWSVFDEKDLQRQREFAAVQANAKYAELLAKGVRVSGRVYGGKAYWTFSEVADKTDTHTAVLVDIREIEKKPECEHCIHCIERVYDECCKCGEDRTKIEKKGEEHARCKTCDQPIHAKG